MTRGMVAPAEGREVRLPRKERGGTGMQPEAESQKLQSQQSLDSLALTGDGPLEREGVEAVDHSEKLSGFGHTSSYTGLHPLGPHSVVCACGFP